MSGHPQRPRPGQRHPARRPLLAATAAIILLVLAACTSTTTTTSAAPVATFSARPGTLTGAGSTFDAPFFTAAFTAYQKQHPAATISYSAVGSSAGIAAFSASHVNFGASDVPMTAAEQAAARGPVTQIPVDLGGEGIVSTSACPPERECT